MPPRSIILVPPVCAAHLIPMRRFDKLQVDGKYHRGWYCVPCKTQYTNIQRAKWALSKPTRWRVYQLKMKCRRYGITPSMWVDCWHSQQGRCRGCEKRLHISYIDHDHQTGEFRGLLCSACNLGIGNFKESIANVRRIYYYMLETA